MKKTIRFLITGVGGQGTILASDILAEVGLRLGHDAKKSDILGLAVRGGSVVSHIIWGENVRAPMIDRGTADYYLSFEWLEGLRRLVYTNKDTVVLANDWRIDPVSVSSGQADYPDADGIRAAIRERCAGLRVIPATQLAVVMAAVCNFLGVVLGGLSVAYALVHMLPTDLLLNMGSSHGLAMVFSMLLAAIIWNLGTWYFGLPASSSHTLIGAIIGIGLTNALMTGTSVVDALNIPKVLSIFGSLIVSPIVGLVFAGGLIFLLRRYWSGTKKRARIHLTPAEREKKDGKKKPPFWTRIALILSAIGVAFSHGANDGQKGIGLVMLVLIGVAPAGFVVNMNATGYEITRTRDAINNVEAYFEQHPALLKQATGADQLVPAPEAGATQPAEFHCHPSNTINALNRLKGMLTTDVESYDKLSLDQRSQMRRIMLCVSDTIDKVVKMPGVSADDQRLLKKLKSDMLSTIEYAPVWIIMAVALALGIGTMIGWRRVATTIGEKIGKKGMTYAQGMSAQMTAAVSIGLASYTGMPVSTTHVLSSSVAGTMVVDGGGLQRKTVTSILMAWVFTLPAAVLLSGGLYWLSLQFL